ncbi:aspartate/methionine/tyrosine aminotransferase [Rhodovulum bhavnagarense]|uniref:aspartate transaminase n=1 Tax=Rhodovulum bhavnagarense TaxID=992286 RepID=A0A4R2RHV0_9RHOB|nr:aminotransferase [Rhodovulum bhavnagarense]TCP62019.1 aspartate/methionine/tyrosine aminotransferase [Rhodovulum bhavnagarense]
MTDPLNPRMGATIPSPVMEARRWLEGVRFEPDRPLINVSQAAPMEAPPEGLRRAIAEAAINDSSAHLYGPVLGLPELRAEIASQWSTAYGGDIAADQVAITQGCNQAFCAAMATLAGEGDEVIVPTPWYFNHAMWLSMQGIRTVPLVTGDSLVPEVQRAASLITGRTRAIVLVTPNNPAGVEYPAQLLGDFRTLCRRHGIALVVDETYRDFDSRLGAPHELFADPHWDDTLIHLYSFSKAYRLTGHRVGALIAGRGRLAEVEKFLDTVAICPNQLGQRAALWGMRNLGKWLAREREEVLSRRAAIEAGLSALPGWSLLAAGAYFAYARHPYGLPSDRLARRLVNEAGVLLLPGTMFRPPAEMQGRDEVRIAFANADRAGLATLFERLGAFCP